MKKLMFIAVAMAAGVCLADITSSNVVGYLGNDFTGKVWNGFTPSFSMVGTDSNVYQMKDIKADQFDETSDNLQLLEPTEARTIKTYFSYEGHWYEDVEEWYEADDDQFDMGSGFLGSFASKTVKMTPAGQVVSGPSAFDYTGKVWVMVGNPIPRTITFKEIEPVSFDETSDNLQLLEPTEARTIKTYFAYNGDWYEDVEEWYEAGDDEIAVGQSLLGSFASKTVKLTFPSAL